MADNSSAAAPENLVQWLEEEQHQQKVTLFKIQQQLEQQQNTIWTFGNRVSSLETALNTMMAHSTRVASLEEGLRRTQELLERSQVNDEDIQQQEAAAERAHQAERERDRQDRIDMLQKLETWEREKIALQERLQAIDEGGRRRQEELFQVTQAMNTLEQKDEELNALISGQQSQTRHLTELLGEVQQNERNIESQQEVIQGRMQHLADLLHRLESGAAMQEVEERLTQALNEQGELHRTERQRLDRMVGETQLSYEQYRSSVEDVRQLTLQVQGKATALNDHMDLIRDQFWQLRTDLAEQFTAIKTGEEQQRRRSISELEQQVKELSAWTPRPPRS